MHLIKFNILVKGGILKEVGKRYKKGNVGRKKKNKKLGEIYYNREILLNSLIKEMWDNTYSDNIDFDNFTDYEYMNKLRLDIKSLLDNQGRDMYKVSMSRRAVYYNQLSKFKKCYSYWKKMTYLVYIFKRYDIPVHLYYNVKEKYVRSVM